jgi:hypothetical protein
MGPEVASVRQSSSRPGRRLVRGGQLSEEIWLAGFRSARTGRAHVGDLAAFAGYCTARGLDVLSARRASVDLHTTGMLDAGATRPAPSRDHEAPGRAGLTSSGQKMRCHQGRGAVSAGRVSVTRTRSIAGWRTRSTSRA